MMKKTATLFDKLTDVALRDRREYAPLRPVVEKELLHRDILREMSAGGFLKDLTFMGGICLRLCHGSPRLSEYLGFTGGFAFKKDDLADLGRHLEKSIHAKYGLAVKVAEPVREDGNVSTWKIRMVTRPESASLPAQRIHVDICALPSHERRPVMLKDLYGLDAGSSGLIVGAESLDEILVDKIIALGNRPNRIKQRDVWDIVWLNRLNITLNRSLLARKLDDRSINPKTFGDTYAKRLDDLQNGQVDFLFEMRRFLASSAFDEQFNSPLWWEHALAVLRALGGASE